MIPFVPSPPSSQTTASPPPSQMVSIVWALNPETGYYDIFNEYTPLTNEGSLQVIKSKIQIILAMYQGEFAPQPNIGIPFNLISQNSDNPNVLSQIIVEQILAVQNVNNVTVLSFNYTETTRTFTAAYNVNTLYGVTTVTTG